MQCKNYYLLSEEELDASIAAIREWMWKFPTHPEMKKADFALGVALNAKEVREDVEKDPFLKLVIDTLC
jgi:hypothetical protein